MSHTTRNPIHKLRILRIWKQTPILLRCRLLLRHLTKLSLLLLLSSSLFFLPSLSLCAVV